MGGRYETPKDDVRPRGEDERVTPPEMRGNLILIYDR
jgi:hypothetical protein